MSHFVLLMFAVLGFFVAVRELGFVFVIAARRLIGLIFKLVSLFAVMILRFIGVLFQLAGLLTRVVRNLLLVALKIVSLIALTLESFFKVFREPNFVHEPTVPENTIRAKRGTVFPTVRAFAWCLFAPTCVMMTFLALSGALNRKWDRGLLSMKKPLPSNLIAPNSLNRFSLNSEETSTATQTSAVDLATNKPEWMSAGNTLSGDVERIVLSSQLWTTVDEARKELKTKAVAIVDADFKRRHHDLLDPKLHRFVSEDRLERIAVKDRFVERVELDFGTMNRLWWLIEISPLVRTELYSQWRAAKVQNRAIAVGTGLAFLTLMANSGALFVFLKRVSRWSSFRAITVTVSGIVAWVSAGLIAVAYMIC